MFFSVAGIEANPIVPAGVALVISFFGSMGGVSGAFLLLPFQMSILGFTAPAVSATNQLFNIVAIPSGIWRYIREGRMVWPMAWLIILGTLPGVLIGALLRIKFLPDPRDFKLFVGLVLLYIGFRLFQDLVNYRKRDKQDAEGAFYQVVQRFKMDQRKQEALPRVQVISFGPQKLCYEFYGQQFRVNTLALIGLSLVVGLVGGVYGIGGGALIAPYLVSVMRLPVYTVAGAALTGTFVASVAGVVFYQALAPFYPAQVIAPDWGLGLCLGLGGLMGMYLGARAQKFLPAKSIKLILLVCILFVALKYVWGFFAGVERFFG